LAKFPFSDPPALKLDQALQLLRQSGREPPPGEPGSTPWLQGLIDALVELSSRDALTGLANRRSFELAIAREIDRVARSGEAALLLSLDIDHFKRINDEYGHPAGDRVLRAVAEILAETVRPMDLVARVGGEEFAIILPNCPAHFGEAVAERIRRRVQSTPVFFTPNGPELRVTMSVGGAYAPPWVRSTVGLWLSRADHQLYRAKASGRNLVCMEAAIASHVSVAEKQMLFGLTTAQDME
jgi:diguanylate cyclase (GGDEF)-like protein